MLTATISHDMRTPLNSILGMGAKLKRFITKDHGIILHDVLMNSASLLLFLVNDLLDLFKIKNDKFAKNLMMSDIRQEIQELLQIFQMQTKEKGLQLIFHCDDSVPHILNIDI